MNNSTSPQTASLTSPQCGPKYRQLFLFDDDVRDHRLNAPNNAMADADASSESSSHYSEWVTATSCKENNTGPDGAN